MKYLLLAIVGVVLTGCAINLNKPELQALAMLCYLVAFLGNKFKYMKENA